MSGTLSWVVRKTSAVVGVALWYIPTKPGHPPQMHWTRMRPGAHGSLHLDPEHVCGHDLHCWWFVNTRTMGGKDDALVRVGNTHVPCVFSAFREPTTTLYVHREDDEAVIDSIQATVHWTPHATKDSVPGSLEVPGPCIHHAKCLRSTMRQLHLCVARLRQNIPHAPSTFSAFGKRSPWGTIPSWVYLQHLSRVKPRVPRLLRLVQLARWQMGLDQVTEAVDLTTVQLAELLGECLTLLAHAVCYVPDRGVRLINDTPQEHRLVLDTNDDQWLCPLVSSEMDHVGGDCEDTAMLVFAVARHFQSATSKMVSSTPASGASSTRAREHRSVVGLTKNLCALSKRYCIAQAVVTLRAPYGQPYIYHSVCVAFDRRLLSLLCLKPDERGDPVPSDVLPMLFLEGTEYTTSCLGHDVWPTPTMYTHARLKHRSVRAKIPADSIHYGGQYDTLITLCTPEFQSSRSACTLGLLTLDPATGPGPALGVPVSHFRAHRWDHIYATNLDSVSKTSLGWGESVAQLFPLSSRLPAVDQDQLDLPPWRPKKSLLHVMRTRDVAEAQAAMVQQAAEQKLDTVMTHQSPFRGVHLTYVISTPPALPMEAVDPSP